MEGAARSCPSFYRLILIRIMQIIQIRHKKHLLCRGGGGCISG